jgi:hypothetical protein
MPPEYWASRAGRCNFGLKITVLIHDPDKPELKIEE